MYDVNGNTQKEREYMKPTPRHCHQYHKHTDLWHMLLVSPPLDGLSIILKYINYSLFRHARYLLEDGKLNLSLRNLVEYKTYQWEKILFKSNGSRSTEISVSQHEKY